jgi:uncharacterized protein (TIGR00369 family)
MHHEFQPSNPRFREVVTASFGRQTFMAKLGARLVAVEPGQVEIAVDRAPDLLQQNGFVHAGVITSIADSACGYAALTLAAEGHDVLAVEFKINLLSPARAERFIARGRVLRPGRTLTVAQADVFEVDGSGGEQALVATLLSTVIARPERG